MQCRIANVSSSPLPLADRYNYEYTRSSEHSIFQQIRETDVNTNRRSAKINISREIMEDTELTMQYGISNARLLLDVSAIVVIKSATCGFVLTCTMSLIEFYHQT